MPVTQVPPVMSLSFSEKLEAALIPTILQRTARLLQAGDFPPRAFLVDDKGNTVIDIDCSPERMFAEAHRLHHYLLSLGVPAYVRACDGTEEESDPFVAIQAVYDPCDREASIEVWGLRDSMLH